MISIDIFGSRAYKRSNTNPRHRVVKFYSTFYILDLILKEEEGLIKQSQRKAGQVQMDSKEDHLPQERRDNHDYGVVRVQMAPAVIVVLARNTQ
ncbi:hypothetical protein EUGRSUZ_H02167 [Eucalyptus grandis]|uniref:Uncharacterized protein n=2 Tax=Eucalyptus grandis TaxID=71139 RepID=A0ACC3JQA5_EUCGR|nr:hypothetical protein EUGRSUZ_H02167 [Eucalyptus grandis]